ncbi:hypothetical protein AB0M79_34780 [Polymorphospora sp. NPDC051019]
MRGYATSAGRAWVTDFAHELRYRSGSCVVTDRATGRSTVNWAA